jgi:hypothetical protein
MPAMSPPNRLKYVGFAFQGTTSFGSLRVSPLANRSGKIWYSTVFSTQLGTTNGLYSPALTTNALVFGFKPSAPNANTCPSFSEKTYRRSLFRSHGACA